MGTRNVRTAIPSHSSATRSPTYLESGTHKMAMGSLTFSAPMMGKNLSYQSQRLSQSRITLARTTVTRRTCPLPRRAALRTSLKIQATSDKQSVKLPEPISPPALINASPKNDTVIHDFTKKVYEFLIIRTLLISVTSTLTVSCTEQRVLFLPVGGVDVFIRYVVANCVQHGF